MPLCVDTQELEMDGHRAVSANVQEVPIHHHNRNTWEATEKYDKMLSRYKQMQPSKLPESVEDPPTWTLIMVPNDTGMTLFCDVTSPDIVARLEGGECWFCGGSREICAGCTHGRAQEFDLFMSCGTDMACPNCMGVDVAHRDKEFQHACIDYENVTIDEIRARTRELNARLAELGYPPKRWRDDEADEMEAMLRREQEKETAELKAKEPVTDQE